MLRYFFKYAGDIKSCVLVKTHRLSDNIFRVTKKFFSKLVRYNNGGFIIEYAIFIAFDKFERKNTEIILTGVLSRCFNAFAARRKSVLRKPIGWRYSCCIFNSPNLLLNRFAQ